MFDTQRHVLELRHHALADISCAEESKRTHSTPSTHAANTNIECSAACQVIFSQLITRIAVMSRSYLLSHVKIPCFVRTKGRPAGWRRVCVRWTVVQSRALKDGRYLGTFVPSFIAERSTAQHNNTHRGASECELRYIPSVRTTT